MKKIIIVAVVIVAVIIIWTQRESDVQNTSKEPIKIGAVLSLTGDAAPWGESIKNGIELAVKNINVKGGIKGREVTVIYEDDHTDGKQAVSAYNKLVDIDRVQGIIGGVFDFTAQPLLPLAEKNKIAFVTPGNFRIEDSFELGTQSFTLLINFEDVIRYYKDYLSQPKIKKIAVVHFTSTWGVEITKVLGEIMNSYGKEKPIEEIYTQIGGNDFKTTIAKLKKEKIDTVFLDTLGEDSVNFLKRSKELGFNPSFLTYIGALESFNQVNDKSLIENIALVNWEISSKEFNELYQKEFNQPAGKSADKAFDSVYILATAIANTESPSEVASYIESHDFETPNAKINFQQDHTVKSTPIEIQVIKNGIAVPFKP